MRLVFFDDGCDLAPLSDLRPTFDLRTGVRTTLERWRDATGADLHALYVPPRLADLVREQAPVPVNTLPPAAESLLVVNGRCPLPTPDLLELPPGTIATDPASGQVVAAKIDSGLAGELLATARYPKHLAHRLDTPRLIARCWQWRTWRDRCIAHDLAAIARVQAPATTPPPGVVAFGTHPIIIDPSAKVLPSAVLDSSLGPILIGPRATVRPGAILVGPCAILDDSSALEHALIRPQTVVGPACKVSGEVSGTIFQGWSNKAHDGFLGDSYVGSWVNLGAGTTNSNLLNTYGHVPVCPAPGAGYEKSGEQFLGSTIGDHVKTAICTRLMTGVVIHTGAMLAATPPAAGCVQPFAWVTDAGEKTYRPEKFLEVMRAAMARRSITPGPAYTHAVRLLIDQAIEAAAASTQGSAR